MKRISTIILSLFMTGSMVISQPASGKLFFTGNLSVYSAKDKSKTGGTTEENLVVTSFSFIPGAGYFLNDRLAVGTSIGINVWIEKNPEPFIGEPEKYTETTFLVGPFCRYYLIAGQGGVFAEASFDAGFGKGKLEYEGGSVEASSMDFIFGVSPGVYYYITEKLALEAKIGWMGYQTEIVTDEDDNKEITSAFGLDFFPSGGFSFGLTITL